MSEIFDALVIGGGPGGLSAALTMARQLHTVAVFDSQTYRNDAAQYQHMVLGWDHKEPSEFRAAARENMLSQYDTVQVLNITIETVKKTEDGGFEATDNSGKIWKGKKLVLASGIKDVYPKIEGFAECWGKGIYHCLFCKGYEDRGAESSGLLVIDLLTSIPHALYVGRHALRLSTSVTFYTNGSLEVANQLIDALAKTPTPQMHIESRTISKLVKGPKSGEVILHFADGTEKTEAFLGAVPIMKQRAPFAEQLGIDLSPGGEMVAAQPFMQTNVKGVFAAGDCGSQMKFVANALATGAAVGAGASGQLVAENMGHQPLF